MVARKFSQVYALDRLIEYGTQPLPETLVVVNPAWRRLDQSVRRERARLYRLEAEFGARTLPAQPSAEQIQNFERDRRPFTGKNPSSRAHAQRAERKTPPNSLSRTYPRPNALLNSGPKRSTSSTPSNSLPFAPRAPWRAKSAKRSPATMTTVRSYDDSLSTPLIYVQSSMLRLLRSRCSAWAALCKTVPSHICASF